MICNDRIEKIAKHSHSSAQFCGLEATKHLTLQDAYQLLLIRHGLIKTQSQCALSIECFHYETLKYPNNNNPSKLERRTVDAHKPTQTHNNPPKLDRKAVDPGSDWIMFASPHVLIDSSIKCRVLLNVTYDILNMLVIHLRHNTL